MCSGEATSTMKGINQPLLMIGDDSFGYTFVYLIFFKPIKEQRNYQVS